MAELVALALREAIVVYARRSLTDGLVVMAQGNFSARDPDTGYIAITPHEQPYAGMTPNSLVIVDVDGKKVAGEHSPSFETPVHCTVYRERPAVMAVAHTEPPYINAFGALGRAIPPITSTTYKAAGGTIAIMPYRRSGSVEFAQEMLAVMGDSYGVVWANHGMMVVGPNIDLAYERSLAIETGARVYHLALQLGEPQTLAWIKDRGSIVA